MKKRITAIILILALILSTIPAASAADIPFADVPENSYYTKPVEWAYENGYIGGTSETTFSPNKNCTRAEIVTMLWAIAGRPLVQDDTINFDDVPPDSYYYMAVKWAVFYGMTSGTSATTFSPNAPCTRAETVFFIWKYFGMMESDLDLWFTDLPGKAYYLKALRWAVDNGVTAGVSALEFGPKTTVTRAMAVTFLYKTRHLLAGEPHEFVYQYTRDATCLLPQADAYKCACGTGKLIYSGGLGDHDYEYVEEVPATCLRCACEKYRCSVCGEEKLLELGGAVSGHDFVLVSTTPATCTEGKKENFACSFCGEKKVVDLGGAVGHNYKAASIVSEATRNKATVYQLRCTRCGKLDGKDRTLGKPIFAEPNIQSAVPTHQWTAAEKKNGIKVTSSTGAYAVVTRKWFGNAWCYIADMTFPAGTWPAFTGTSVYNRYGANDPYKYHSAYDEMKYQKNAKLLFNGDACLWNETSSLRGGIGYGSTVAGGATYWNAATGTYGTVSSLGTTKISELVKLGVKDTMYFGSPVITNGQMSMSYFNQYPDYDAASYNKLNYRRQRSLMGFKKEGSVVHVYIVVADGTTYTNVESRNPDLSANDRASYGNIGREMMILMSTLDVDYAVALDGGWSATMMIRINGKVEQINAADFGEKNWNPYEGRMLWDFLTFS